MPPPVTTTVPLAGWVTVSIVASGRRRGRCRWRARRSPWRRVLGHRGRVVHRRRAGRRRRRCRPSRGRRRCRPARRRPCSRTRPRRHRTRSRPARTHRSVRRSTPCRPSRPTPPSPSVHWRSASVSFSAGLPAPETGRSSWVSSVPPTVSSTATGSVFPGARPRQARRGRPSRRRRRRDRDRELLLVAPPPPSLTRIPTGKLLCASKSKTVFVPSVVPGNRERAVVAGTRAGDEAVECASPAFGSVTVSLPTVVATGWFSATLAGLSERSLGARFWSTFSQSPYPVGVSAIAPSTPVRRTDRRRTRDRPGRPRCRRRGRRRGDRSRPRHARGRGRVRRARRRHPRRPAGGRYPHRRAERRHPRRRQPVVAAQPADDVVPGRADQHVCARGTDHRATPAGPDRRSHRHPEQQPGRKKHANEPRHQGTAQPPIALAELVLAPY